MCRARRSRGRRLPASAGGLPARRRTGASALRSLSGGRHRRRLGPPASAGSRHRRGAGTGAGRCRFRLRPGPAALAVAHRLGRRTDQPSIQRRRSACGAAGRPAAATSQPGPDHDTQMQQQGGHQREQEAAANLHPARGAINAPAAADSPSSRHATVREPQPPLEKPAHRLRDR